MFTYFHIERFRGIPQLDIVGVRPVTLLVGKNNTGKTSVLEAIFLLCGATSPINTVRIGQLRGQRVSTAGDADAVWRSLFRAMDPSEPALVTGFDAAKGERRLELEALDITTYTPDAGITGAVEANGRRMIGGIRLRYTTRDDPGWTTTQAVFDPRTHQVSAPGDTHAGVEPAAFLSARSFVNPVRDADQYSALVKTRQEQDVIYALSLVDPRVRDLAVVSEAAGATVYADVGGEALIPLAVCGEGMLRLFSIVLAITSVRGGVLLVDEIDNGLHHSVMADLWPALRTLCVEYTVQLIATTHNEEMLKYAVEAFRDDFNQFGLFRLDRTPDGLRAVGYNAEALEGVAEAGWEVRG